MNRKKFVTDITDFILLLDILTVDLMILLSNKVNVEANEEAPCRCADIFLSRQSCSDFLPT